MLRSRIVLSQSVPSSLGPTQLSAKAVIPIAVCLLFSAWNLAAQEEQAFRGAVAASACLDSNGGAAISASAETLERCAISHAKSARFVLSSSNNTVYQLDDQTRAKPFAGRNVVIIGALDKVDNSLHVHDMFPALSSKIMQARTVYIDCSSCLRDMAKADQAAREQLRDWRRFVLVSDPQKADLVFLFSPNKYLEDYAQRQGPDPRPVRVFITYMNVIDPRTGESLWDDSSKSGSWRVRGATNSLISEFRSQLEAEEGRIERLLLQDEARSVQVPPAVGK